MIAAASENGGVVTNGMSQYARDENNSNSAIVVSVMPSDFGSSHPLAGVEYQRKWESRAYKAGGGDFTAPVQRVGDFLKLKKSTTMGSIYPTYKPYVKPSDLTLCLPSYVLDSLKQALIHFNCKIKGFANPDAVLTGIETRTSSPVRIVRTNTMESETHEGIYPAGEGAGYAGGIISSAVDGLKAAEAIINKYKPFN